MSVAAKCDRQGRQVLLHCGGPRTVINSRPNTTSSKLNLNSRLISRHTAAEGFCSASPLLPSSSRAAISIQVHNKAEDACLLLPALAPRSNSHLSPLTTRLHLTLFHRQTANGNESTETSRSLELIPTCSLSNSSYPCRLQLPCPAL